MKKNQKLWNREAKKVAYFVSRDSEYTVVRIDGLNTPIKNEKFDLYYEVINE